MAKAKIPTPIESAKQALMARAVFGGRKLSLASMRYVRSAQLHFGVLEVESALDGRDLFCPEWKS